MRRATIAVLALAVIGLTVTGIAAAHFQRYPTTVTIKLKGSKGKSGKAANTFDGKVNSALPRCQKGRTVLVSRDGALVGQTVSDSTGSWQLGLGGQAAPAGNYTATALKKVYRRHRPGHPRHKHVCKKGVSKALSVKGTYTAKR
jgi:uncharacterized iron-regulated membrane protein